MNILDFLTNTIAGATIQIAVMLSVAFVLGYLLTHSSVKKWRNEAEKRKNQITSLLGEIENSKKRSREMERDYLDLSTELKKTHTLLKRTKTNFKKLKEEHLALKSSAADWDELNSALSAAKRKITRLEKIKDDQRAQIDKFQRELLSSRVAASKKSSNGVVKKNGKQAIQSKDDLTKIHGIGPKIQSVLNEHGIQTFTDLGKTGIKQLRTILKESGKSIKSVDPKLWSKQAKLIKREKWSELNELLKN